MAITTSHGSEARSVQLAGGATAIEDLYRLSPVQQGMLFHCLAAPWAGMYFEQALVNGIESAGLGGLRSACAEVVARHPILRTSFQWRDLKKPVQVVHREVPVDLRVIDLPSDLSDAECRRRLQHLMDEDRREGFDLTRPPLTRWTLIRAGEGRTWGLWSYHHLLLDGWSALAVARETVEVFSARARGEEPALPSRRPFREYIAWLGRQDLAGAETFWRRLLNGRSGPTRPAADRGPGKPPGRHGRIDGALGPDAMRALGEMARRRRVTLGTVLQAAWGLVLSRFSGDDDVVFGITVSGRPPSLEGVESILGCFINTLPVRVRCAPSRPIDSWLRELQADQAEMRRHEHSPLVSIRRWAGLPPDQPLFEAILVFENFDADFAASEEHAPRVQRTNFPLVLLAEPQGETLHLRIGFDQARYAETEARRLLHAVETVLGALPAAANGRIGDLPLLPRSETHRARVEWNDEPGLRDAAPAVHRQVAAVAASVPDRIALTTADGTHWTYGSLAVRAHALAHRLAALGVGPGTVVAVALERSPELVAALLGVLEAGAAYLPLDLEHPDGRIAVLLADAWGPAEAWDEAGPCLAVAAPGFARRLHELEGRVVTVAGESPDREAALATPEPEHPAYVIYTSGSTGRPKGVVVQHGALANRIAWGARHDVGRDCAFLHKTTVAFDVSVLEIFLPLATAGRIVVSRPGGQRDPEHLVALMARERVTHASFPPAFYPSILALPELDRCAGLQVLYTAGEAVTAGLAARVAERLPVRFENRYGPTETTIGVLGWLCRGEDEADPVPVGRPVAGATVHVLGASGTPMPPGAPGELVVGGPGVARGYLRRPARTAEAFVPDPFGGAPGNRLYRTGDLARFRSDGATEFLGRIDRQVKVRGFRVELEEIEFALLALPGVREAAVVLRGESDGGGRLVAYWVPEAGAGTGEEELRRALGGQLATYMVPTSWVRMDALPRTSSLKLDLRALPEPAATEAGFVAPRTDTERVLAEAWCGVLELDRVGVHDRFHDLGGHSLHLVRLASEIRKRFGHVPPLAEIAGATTVAELARVVEEAARGTAADPAERLERMSRDARLDESIRPGAGTPVSPAENRPPLLTGATGFLGAHLLAELLLRTGGPVICVVRARDEAHALERLRRKLVEERLWNDGFEGRLVPVVGDLTADRLGLSEEEHTALAERIGPIFHNAATVDLLRSYEDLAAANVRGTTELLRLACTGRPKPFHYVSTLSVFEGAETRGIGVADEEADVSDPTGLVRGYAQSKWVAERLVRQAQERGLPVTVFRPGVVAGDSRSGISSSGDFAGRLFRGCIELGMVPEDLRGPARLSPVDFVSRAIVRLALDEGNAGRTFHPLNPETTTIERLFDRAEERGFAVSRVPYPEWRRALAAAVEAGRDNALAPLLPLFGNGEPDAAETAPEPPRPALRYECRITARALAEAGVEPPPGEAGLLERYLHHWVSRGLLPAPEGAAELPEPVLERS